MDRGPYRLTDDSPSRAQAPTYRCEPCDTTFAEGALRRIVVGRREAYACPVCGHGVTRFGSGFGREVQSFPKLLLGAFGYPLRQPMAIAAFGFALMASSFVGLRWVVLLSVYAYLLLIITKTGKGEDEPPAPADFTEVWDLFHPAIRFVLALVAAFLPLSVAAFLGVRAPWLAALGGLGLVYLPAAVIVAAESSSLLSPLTILPALAIIVRVPAGYFTMIGFLALALGAGWGIAAAAARIAEVLVAIPVLPELLGSIVLLYAPFVIARMLGLLVREHAEEL